MTAIEIGFRDFLVIDEGLIWLLKRMKEAGDIPSDVVFKTFMVLYEAFLRWGFPN